MITFPNDFLFGASLSAYKVEGGNFSADWWRWEQRPGRIEEGSSSEIAAGHLGRFLEDIDLARKLGLRALQLSIEWSRIQPSNATSYDEDAISHYAAALDAINSAGIMPVVVLHHVTRPNWFAAAGGWARPGSPETFARYAARVARKLASRCRWWIPILEPMHTLTMGYLERTWPPASSNLYKGLKSIVHMAHAHARAYRAIRTRRDDARIGPAVRGRLFTPLDDSNPWHLRAARREERRCNNFFLDALINERWPWGRDSELAHCVDFIGLSYYGSNHIRFALRRPTRLMAALCSPNGDPVPAWHAEPDPGGLPELLQRLAQYERPVLITGNGIATDDDDVRCRYLLEHLAVLRKAMDEGAQVAGYMHRAFLDGFEWTRGVSARYGMVHVDWKSLARTPNGSAYLYKDICDTGEIRSGVVERFCPGWRPPVSLENA